jgi:hypothetical protein
MLLHLKHCDDSTGCHAHNGYAGENLKSAEHPEATLTSRKILQAANPTTSAKSNDPCASRRHAGSTLTKQTKLQRGPIRHPRAKMLSKPPRAAPLMAWKIADYGQHLPVPSSTDAASQLSVSGG